MLFFSLKGHINYTYIKTIYHDSPITQKPSSETKAYTDTAKISTWDIVTSFSSTSTLKTSIEKTYYCNAFQISIQLTTKYWAASK